MICVNKGDVPDLQTALFYSLVHVRSEECPESFHLWSTVENEHDALHVSELSISSSRVRPSSKKTHTVTPQKSRVAHLSTIRLYGSRSVSVLCTHMYVFIKEGYYVIFFLILCGYDE